MLGRSRRNRDVDEFWTQLHHDVAPLFDYWVDEFYREQDAETAKPTSAWRGFTVEASVIGR